MLLRQRQMSREHSRMRQYDRPRLLSRETLGGVDLELPPRGPDRKPPRFE
jgi:hypothetical protein